MTKDYQDIIDIEKNGHSPQVMVVDDNRSDLFLIASMLKSLRCKVMTVNDPLKALTTALDLLPDVILLDVQMPGLDGFTLCRQLKGHKGLSNIPIIFLTQLHDITSKIKGLNTGASDYLVKPVQPDELRARVTTQFRLCRTQQNLRRNNKHLQEKIHDLELTQTALQESEARLESVFNNAAVCIALINTEGRYELVNERCAELFGYSRQELETMSCWQIISEEFQDATRTIMAKILSVPDFHNCSAKKFVRKHGEIFWGACYLDPRLDSSGKCLGFVCIIIDLTDQRNAEKELRLAQTIFETCNEGLVICDADNNIIMVNPAFSTITGYSKKDVIGCNPSILQSGRHDKEFYTSMWNHLLHKNHWKGEIWNRRKDNSIYPELLSISIIRNNKGQVLNFVSVFTDITEQKNVETLLQRQALHDPLTGLLNRAAFDERLGSELNRAERERNTMALLYIDLDCFKSINDNMGHLVGDNVLQQVADHLQRYSRAGDIIARLGGDEFVVLLPSIENQQQVTAIVDRMYSNLNFLSYPDVNQDISFSIGIALYPEHAQTAQQLLRRADDAMYTAKHLGRGQYRFAEKSK